MGTPAKPEAPQQDLAVCSATAGAQQPLACATSCTLSGAQQALPAAALSAVAVAKVAVADASTLFAGTWRILSASAMAAAISASLKPALRASGT